jgi:pimeloyl-ACP methyl ester carboxylesterase
MTLRRLIQTAAIATCCTASLHAQAEVERIHFNGKDFKGGQLIVPKPKPGAENTKRWVVVDVHGLGGPKKNWFGHRMLKWVGEDKAIALAPVFTGDYHLADDQSSKQLIGHFEEIRKNHNVHDKMFLYGFSAGAQFVHRFAFKHPELVVGVSAHSAGAWSGIEGWEEINDKAKDIPFALSCGELDTEKAFGGTAPHGRLDWMRFFAGQLKERGFAVRTDVHPGIGHGGTADTHGQLIRECFQLATEGIVPEDNQWQGDLTRFQKK